MELGTSIGLLAVIGLTLTFEGMLYGTAIAEQSFGSFSGSTPTSCSDNNFGCIIDFIQSIFAGIFGGITFLFNLLTFNVPGAPVWIRAPVATIIVGGIVLLVVSIFRGN